MNGFCVEVLHYRREHFFIHDSQEVASLQQFGSLVLRCLPCNHLIGEARKFRPVCDLIGPCGTGHPKRCDYHGPQALEVFAHTDH